MKRARNFGGIALVLGLVDSGEALQEKSGIDEDSSRHGDPHRFQSGQENPRARPTVDI